MFRFYRNATFAFLTLIILTLMIVYAGVAKSKLNTPLFPARDQDLPWISSTEPPSPVGKTVLSLKSEVGTIEYEFLLDPEKPFPYTHYSMYFIEADQPYRLVDLTRYSSFSFKVLCDPKNVLLLVLFSFDEKVTDINQAVTRRVSSTAFSCSHHWNTITIGFDELDTPHWWLGRYGYEYSDRGYQLDKVMGFAFVNSLQSPLDTPSYVKLTDIKLLGREDRYLYAAGVISLCCWIIFFVWIFRQYVVALTEQIREKVKQDQPLIAYKKLSIEPQKDKEKSALLRHIATEYANPDISLEITATTLGINRTKINDILKDELGLTFSAYLNKLRLTEAARLLSESEEANVSEIAYSVGYNNVSYFNKLFKIEYGCTPKMFKSLYLSDSD
ncbi:helix-turn-helix domain-containing protein [Cellvibrio japonicus]|nr:AraC family transcriptional regulator [Cellvibrio japonicus]QEI13543.1 helix-turn-helix transcriptional regulator [Cellvibrio japonicus]QEI17117.1 helix-turn-helix transcriptional regulator [Cellvibrio japonicus]QEI20694.1 helix-turn-helix transcriptional regulator [Cellvibrio japonicus]